MKNRVCNPSIFHPSTATPAAILIVISWGILLSSPTKSPTIPGPLCFLILKRAVTLSPWLKKRSSSLHLSMFSLHLFPFWPKAKDAPVWARGEIDPRLVVGGDRSQHVVYWRTAACYYEQRNPYSRRPCPSASVCVFCGWWASLRKMYHFLLS